MTAVALAALVVLAGCTGSLDGTTPSDAGTGSTGTVNFYVSDEVNDIDRFDHLNVTITKIGLKKTVAEETTATNETAANATTTETEDAESEADGDDADEDDATWVSHDVDNRTVDLTRLTGAKASRLASFDVDEGSYEKAFVYVSEVNGTLENGEHVNVKLPSEKLQIQKRFEVGADEPVDFVFDITVHQTGNSGKFILQPVVAESGTDVPIEDVDEKDDNESDEQGLQVAVDGNVTRGENATLAVTQNGTAVANASVAVNGEDVGTTGEDGTIDVQVPDGENEFEVEAAVGDAEAEYEFEFEETSD